MTTDQTALVAGATGLVGGHLVRRLLDGGAYGRVVSLVRREGPVLEARHDVRVVDFARLGEAALPFDGADVYCALGTTIKVAGSREAGPMVARILVRRMGRAFRRPTGPVNRRGGSRAARPSAIPRKIDNRLSFR